MDAKPKKKKSGCLIAVIVLVLLGAIVAGGGDETVEPAEAETQTEIETVSDETEAETEPTEEVETVEFSGIIIDCENSWSLWSGKNFSAYVDDGSQVWYVTYSGKGAEEVKINDTIECIGVSESEKTYTRDSEEITVSAVALTQFKLYPAPEPETEAETEPVKETEPEIIVTVPENNPTEYTAGQYKIGADMPAGVYVLYQQDYSWMSYFAITSDANGKDILKNDNFGNRSIIEVIDGEYLEINRCSAFPIEEDPGFGKVDGCLLAGSYIVGRDIDPGEYKVEADAGEMTYICIYTDTRRSKIHANDNFEGSRYVALEEGQLFEIKRGRVKIGD
ncbi:MAG: hypothetical protein IIU58_04185 [Clostridia bacterium]|nr:hypothetical protein [Clostridia bacterium]